MIQVTHIPFSPAELVQKMKQAHRITPAGYCDESGSLARESGMLLTEIFERSDRWLQGVHELFHEILSAPK